VYLLGILAVGCAVIAATYRDYGITWDETAQAKYGDLVAAYFASGGEDTRCNDFLNLQHYAPLFDLAGSVAVAGTGGDAFEVRHLLIALTGLGTVVGVALYALSFGGYTAASVAAITLATMPRFHGSAFNNPKDIPFACAFTFSMLALAKWLAAPCPRRAHALVTGLAFGLALGIRPGAFPILVVLAAGAVVGWLATLSPSERSALRPMTLVGDTALLLVVAWMTMVAPWPWAHQAPLANPIAAMREAASFSTTFDVLFDGTTYRSDNLPRIYLPKYLLLSTPPLVLVLAVVGLIAPRRRDFDPETAQVGLERALVSAWLLAPIAAVVVLRPNLYDAYRHFLFLLPAIALLAGLGAQAIVDWARDGAARRVAQAMIVAASLLPIVSLVQLHPYGYAYFNTFAGGLAGADGRYETDYWASSHKEAMEWLALQPRPDNRPLRILVAAGQFNRESAAHYLPADIKMRTTWGLLLPGAALPRKYDYYVGTTRYGYHRNFESTPVAHVVGRDGAAFAVIRANR
jgi:4-amino-4-deoxy-L-arabinose transferase-like glycosyltransferase